jgi:signal peptidase I
MKHREVCTVTALMSMATNGGSEVPTWFRTLLIGRNPNRTAIRIFVLIVVSIIVFRFILLPIKVDGLSMMPAYKANRVNFVNRMAYRWHPPARGDVVAIRTSGISIMYMKRIIGLPGETVSFHKGHAMINGEVLEEPYVKYSCDWEMPPKVLGPDEYYFVGDNRAMPALDHTQGVAPRTRIVGKVLL